MSLNRLREMLTYMRPHGSKHDHIFRAQFLLTLPGAYTDEGSNIHVHISDAPILWSAHTDTVHRTTGRQYVDRTADLLHLPGGSRSTCLGADDTAGCYLLRELIKAHVPGHYIFHYGEERGGIGSSWLARNHADWLATFKYAIALDRAGTGDIITHQMGGRTASDAFALALATTLGNGWQPTHYGIYTDTAEYADLIPECTNLSVGYDRQHSPNESLNTAHLFTLLESLLALDVLALPAVRDPHVPDPDDDWPIYSHHYPGILDSYCDTCDYMYRNRFHGICPDCGATPWLDANATRILDGTIARDYSPDDDTGRDCYSRRCLDCFEWYAAGADDDNGCCPNCRADFLDPDRAAIQAELRRQLKIVS